MSYHNCMVEVDRRIRRTKKALEEALIALALEKEYDEITIQEITDRADIGYRTFFRHFSDKEELLKDALHGMILELREIAITPSPEAFADPTSNPFDLMDSAVLFRHVQKHSDLYRVLMNSDRSFIASVMTVGMEATKADLAMLPAPDIPIDLLTNHVFSAMFTLVRWWLDTDMAISPEVMGEYAIRLIYQPILNLVLPSHSISK